MEWEWKIEIDSWKLRVKDLQDEVGHLKTEIHAVRVHKNTGLLEQKAQIKKQETRIKELETVLKLVQRWGKDSRSVGAWEVFQEVAKALEPVPEQPVTVADCTCIPCVCPGKERWNKGGPCLGCGARTCLAHELAKEGSR